MKPHSSAYAAAADCPSGPKDNIPAAVEGNQYARVKATRPPTTSAPWANRRQLRKRAGSAKEYHQLMLKVNKAVWPMQTPENPIISSTSMQRSLFLICSPCSVAKWLPTTDHGLQTIHLYATFRVLHGAVGRILEHIQQLIDVEGLEEDIAKAFLATFDD